MKDYEILGLPWDALGLPVDDIKLRDEDDVVEA